MKLRRIKAEKKRTVRKMAEFIKDLLSYPFIVRAFIVGIPVALCAALLGVSLVLRRYSMIGDGLSHVGFGALAVAAAVNTAPRAVAVPVFVAAARSASSTITLSSFSPSSTRALP